MSARETHYFKVGVFVLATVSLLFTGVILLGSGVIFRPESFEFESYFDTSVEGIEKGTPVKFRGVKIGAVSSIDFASDIYEDQAETPINLVLIRSRVATKLIPRGLAQNLRTATLEQRREIFDKLIERGLRVRIATAGLAGVTYLELDYHEPKHCPVSELEWVPEIDYIPSVPGLTSHLTESLETTLDTLARVPFDEIAKTLDTLLVALTDQVTQVELGAIAREAHLLIEELRVSNDALRVLLQDPALKALPEEFSGLVVETRSVVKEAGPPLRDLLDSVARAGTKVESLAIALEEKLPPAAEDVRSGATQARAALVSLRRFVQQLEERSDRILSDLQVISEHLKAASEDVRGNPARTLFGDPPPPREEP